MMQNKDFGTELKNLAERLEKCAEVTRYDSKEEKEAWTLAHDFLDLEESFRRFLDGYLLRLKTEKLPPEQVKDLLIDIGEEFRHILYHVRNSRFYRYLESGDESKWGGVS